MMRIPFKRFSKIAKPNSPLNPIKSRSPDSNPSLKPKLDLEMPSSAAHITETKKTTNTIQPVKSDFSKSLGRVSGVPDPSKRIVYIYQPSKSSMQSGLLHHKSIWKIDFDKSSGKWENPLIGWTSSRDPLQALDMKFESSNDAIRFAERQGWNWMLREGESFEWRNKSYGKNFEYTADKLKFIRTK